MARLLRVLLAFFALASASPATAAVRTTGGDIEGAPGRAPSVTVFRGVPYAAPPIGPLRWRPPQPAAPWPGLRTSDRWPNPCYQEPRTAATAPAVRLPARPRLQETPSEDCLYLNVWRPSEARKGDKRPTIVWIFGGGFSTGSASSPAASGDGLAEKGAVVVSFNYRINVFGFMAHPDMVKEQGGTAGNYGLMDMVAALKWVQANIAEFGGDPDNVTIVGCSSGGGAVVLLMASPQAKGLFHRAIAQSAAYSGSPVDVDTLQGATAFGATLSRDMGAPTLEQLRAMPAQAVYRASMAPRGDAKFPFLPIIDGKVLPADTSTIFAAGRQNKVPLIAGCSRDEGVSLAVSPPRAEGFVDKRGAPIGDLALPSNPTQPDIVRGWNRMMVRTAHDLAARLRRTGGQTTFVYYAAFAPPGTDYAYHCADYIYAMNNLDAAPQGGWTDRDRMIARIMSDYWMNFARTGDPNGQGLPRWPVYDPAKPQVLNEGDIIEAMPWTR